MSFFCVKHFKGKKKEEIQKNKVTKTCRKEFFLKNIHQQGNWHKKRDFFRQENREERFPFFCRKLQSAKKTQRQVNEKGGKDSFENKGENTRTENIRKNNEEGGKERVKRRFLQRKIFLFHRTFFRKKSKRDKSRYKKGFLKTLKKGG